MSEKLFRMVMLDAEVPVQYVGTYVLKWAHGSKPDVGFVEIEDDLIGKLRDIRNDLIEDDFDRSQDIIDFASRVSKVADLIASGCEISGAIATIRSIVLEMIDYANGG